MAFGGFQNTHHGTPMAEINTTPLVDVMLVLLVIFIITAPLMARAIKVDLPQASADVAQTKPETLEIGIDAQDQFFWNTEAITLATLRERLEAGSKQAVQPEIHLRADKMSHYEATAQVLGIAHEYGLVKIGFVTLPKSSTPTQGVQP